MFNPDNYNPRKDTQAWLNWLLERVKDVPYDVTGRWAFYRILQEYGFPKGAYHTKFIPRTSDARKAFWNGWTLTTFIDDTREILNPYGHGFTSVRKWLESQRDKRPLFNVEDDQENVVFVGFEAQAMQSQFQYHLGDYRVCLMPFKGDASIPHKRNISMAIQQAHKVYGKPIKFLYFGDCDRKGDQIPESAMRDIERWAKVAQWPKGDFEYKRIGINPEHIKEFNIPLNPDEPKKFQWEALDEKSAQYLIEQVFDYWSKDGIAITKKKEEESGKLWKTIMGKNLENAIAKIADEEVQGEHG